MSAVLTFMLMAALGDPARNITPCDDLREIPLGTAVVVEGRYLTDFMHGEGLVAPDCLVPIALGPRAEGPLADRFLDATWRKRPYPWRDSGGVNLRIKGVLEMEADGHLGLPPQPFIRVEELLAVTVDEGHGQ